MAIYTTHLLEQDATQGQFLSGGLNTEFSFFLTGCHAQDKEPSLPYNWRENSWIHAFHKGITRFISLYAIL